MESKQSPPALKIGLKMWIKTPLETQSKPETDNKSIKKKKKIFGSGDKKLLQSLINTKNLTRSSQELGYSYKYAWKKLRDLTEKTGANVVETYRGGHGGGGEMKVTSWGIYLNQIYNEINERVSQFEEELNKYLLAHPFKDNSK